MGQVVGEQDGAVLSVIGTRGLHGLFKSSSLSDILNLLTNFLKRQILAMSIMKLTFFPLQFLKIVVDLQCCVNFYCMAK